MAQYKAQVPFLLYKHVNISKRLMCILNSELERGLKTCIIYEDKTILLNRLKKKVLFSKKKRKPVYGFFLFFFIFCKHIQPAHLQPDAQGIADTADMSSS